MQRGPLRFSVSTPATGLLPSRWKATAPLLVNRLNAANLGFTHLAIKDAMLKRAARDYEPQSSKDDIAKQMYASHSTSKSGKKIDPFIKARQSSQTIGGFTGVTNLTAPLQKVSANITSEPRRQSINSTRTNQSAGLAAMLGKPNSFTESKSLLQDTGSITKNVQEANIGVYFDENDFDDDLDLDIDYDIPTTISVAPKSTTSTRNESFIQKSPYALPQLQEFPSRVTAFNDPTSSAVTWSSSSPSHTVTPLAGIERRRQEANVAIKTATSKVKEERDDNPRPHKRSRALPWPLSQNDNAPSLKQDLFCSKCEQKGHDSKNCTGNIFSKREHTPKTGSKHIPWNATASTVKEQQKVFRESRQQKENLTRQEQDNTKRKEKEKLRIAPIMLSNEQKRVLELVVNQGKSVFFTGSAGTGKSVLMRSIISELKRKHQDDSDRVAVTASTGLAACNIGGITLHSFGGIGLGKECAKDLATKVRKNQKSKKRWLRTKILIIDEISMVDGDLFDKLEELARVIRNNGRPFGGIQLVITGDFFQLPPVPDFDKSKDVKFAFEASSWNEVLNHTIGLTQVFRQKDPTFANMLNEMRLGKLSDETVKAFRALSRTLSYEGSISATELFPTRNEVDNANAFRMRSLIGKAYRFQARDTGAIKDERMRDSLLANVMAPKMIEFKKGAQVMLIKNMENGLVNGSIGKIIAFMTPKIFEIHISNPGLLRDFDSGLVSEIRDDMDDYALQARAMLTAALNGKPSSDTSLEYPVVQFPSLDGPPKVLLAEPQEWKVELPNGEVQAQRSQVPLILAWALSIHKAQGQTLERVKVDLKKIFEKGQAYVALSRATSQAGLEVQNFDKTKVLAHPRVAEFYNGLYSVDKVVGKANLIKTVPGRMNEKKGAMLRS